MADVYKKLLTLENVSIHSVMILPPPRAEMLNRITKLYYSWDLKHFDKEDESMIKFDEFIDKSIRVYHLNNDSPESFSSIASESDSPDFIISLSRMDKSRYSADLPCPLLQYETVVRRSYIRSDTIDHFYDIASYKGYTDIGVSMYGTDGFSRYRIANGFFRPDQKSHTRSIQNIIGSAGQYFYSACKILSAADEETTFTRHTVSRPLMPQIMLLLAYTKVLLRYVKQVILKKLRISAWGIAFGSYNAEDMTVNITSEVSGEDAAGCFIADPFLYKHEGDTYVFYENLGKNNRGEIYSAKYTDGALTDISEVLKDEIHFSYPLVLPYKDKIYMIPESMAANQIRLYESEEFPNKWNLKRVLIDNTAASDSTLLCYNNKWWIFTSIAASKGSPTDDNLHIFYADDLFSETWTPHPMNPVLTDVRRSRMAGNFITTGHKIIRPAQDCSKEYGRTLGLYEIVKLNETEYEEVLYKNGSEILKDCRLLHTINVCDGLAVVDKAVVRDKLKKRFGVLRFWRKKA